MATTMALDLGLARKPKPNFRGQQMLLAGKLPDPAEDQASRTRFSGGRVWDVSNEASTADHVMSSKQHLPDSGSLESRRTLLACYLFCASVSQSLRLPNFLRYSSWMADCCEVLKSSPDSTNTDKRFVAWVQLQRLVEECGTNFALDSPDETVSLADERAQLMLRGYGKRMEQWRQHAINNDNVMNRWSLSVLPPTGHAKYTQPSLRLCTTVVTYTCTRSPFILSTMPKTSNHHFQ